MLEVLLSYWLSWFMLPSGPEDRLNSYIVSLVIFLAKGREVGI